MSKKVRGTRSPTSSLRHLFLSAAVILLLAMVLIAPVAAAETVPTCDHTTWTAWGDDEIEKTTLPSSAGDYHLVSDVTLNNRWQIEGLSGDATINLCLNGHVIKLETTDDSAVINVMIGNTLNLYDCGVTPHYFTVEANGLWKLTDTQTADTKTVTGGVITGGLETSGGGCGVYVTGEFNMYGGNIIGNTGACGGGVRGNGNFTMYDGLIAGNYANQGAGIAVNCYDGNTFIMNGGDVTENTAEVSAGGVYVLTGNFILNDGSIANNSARNGGGLDVCDTFTMNGGTIDGNTAMRSGAAVNLAAGTNFTMTGGSITNNINNVNGQYQSGTIHVGGGSVGGIFNLNDGSISENTGGSAVLAYANAVITMKGGEISDNTGANYGGGIYLYGASLIMSDGTISENSAKYGGSGVFVRNDTSDLGDFKGTLTVSGNAIISADNDVYLSEDGSFINVTGATFSGEIKNISGVSIYPDYEIIKITSDNSIASSILDKFALTSAHAGYYSLTADDTANVIKVTYSGGSSGGDDPTPVAVPAVDPSTFTIETYNTTTVNLSFSLTETADADKITVNLLNADGDILAGTIRGGDFPAGSSITDLQFTTLTYSIAYKFKVTVGDSVNNVSSVYEFPGFYTSPSIDRVGIHGLPAYGIIDLETPTGTLTATVQNGTTILHNEPVTWSSDNPTVVEINPYTGEYIAHKVGKANISVTPLNGNFTAPVEVTVTSAMPKVNTATVSAYNATIVNIDFELTQTVDADKAIVSIMNADGSFVTLYEHLNYIGAGVKVSDIRFNDLRPNTTYLFNITLQNSTINGISNVYEDTFTTPAIANIVIAGVPDGNIIDLIGNRQGTLTATVEDGDGNILPNESVYWASDNAAITIDGTTGAYTANAKGIANISATAINDPSAITVVTLTVTSTMPTVDADTVTATAYNATIADINFNLTNVLGADEIFVNLTSATTALSETTGAVDAGNGTTIRFTGLAAGTTYNLTITPLNSSVIDGTPVVYETSFTTPAITSVILSGYPASKVLDINSVSDCNLTAVVNVANEPIVWESDNTTVATVVDGKVTAVAVGTANITAKAVNNESAFETVLFTVINTTTAEPELPVTADKDETTGETTITATQGNTITVDDDDKKTAVIEDTASGVTLTVTFNEEQTMSGQVSEVNGTVASVEATYAEAPVAPAENMTGTVTFSMKLDLKNVTTALPKMNTTINNTVINVLSGKDAKLQPMAMVTAETNVNSINVNMNTVTLTFVVSGTWFTNTDEIYIFHVKNGAVQNLEKIDKSKFSVGADGKVRITHTGTSFSTYGIAGKETESNSGNQGGSGGNGGGSSGGSTWASTTPTETPTPSVTPTDSVPTDTAPTDLPTGQPTATQTQSPGFGVLGVLTGLGAVAVLRRR